MSSSIRLVGVSLKSYRPTIAWTISSINAVSLVCHCPSLHPIKLLILSIDFWTAVLMSIQLVCVVCVIANRMSMHHRMLSLPSMALALPSMALALPLWFPVSEAGCWDIVFPSKTRLHGAVVDRYRLTKDSVLYSQLSYLLHSKSTGSCVVSHHSMLVSMSMLTYVQLGH